MTCSTKIDTARTYAGGTSEEYLGKIDLLGKGFKLETKLAPRKVLLNPSTRFRHDFSVLIWFFQGIADPIDHDAEVNGIRFERKTLG